MRNNQPARDPPLSPSSPRLAGRFRGASLLIDNSTDGRIETEIKGIEHPISVIVELEFATTIHCSTASVFGQSSSGSSTPSWSSSSSSTVSMHPSPSLSCSSCWWCLNEAFWTPINVDLSCRRCHRLQSFLHRSNRLHRSLQTHSHQSSFFLKRTRINGVLDAVVIVVRVCSFKTTVLVVIVPSKRNQES